MFKIDKKFGSVHALTAKFKQGKIVASCFIENQPFMLVFEKSNGCLVCTGAGHESKFGLPSSALAGGIESLEFFLFEEILPAYGFMLLEKENPPKNIVECYKEGVQAHVMEELIQTLI